MDKEQESRDTTMIPRWRIYLYAALVVAGLAYLAWSIWGPRPPAPGQTITAQTAPAVAKMPQKVITPRKVVVIADPVRATEKLKIPPPQRNEEVQTAVVVPQTRYGGTATVFLNSSTGQSRTVIRANESPWFRFERENRAGVEVGIGSHGRYYQADYQRDILSVKGVVVSGRAAVVSYPDETSWSAGVRAEYRW